MVGTGKASRTTAIEGPFPEACLRNVSQVTGSLSVNAHSDWAGFSHLSARLHSRHGAEEMRIVHVVRVLIASGLTTSPGYSISSHEQPGTATSAGTLSGSSGEMRTWVWSS